LRETREQLHAKTKHARDRIIELASRMRNHHKAGVKRANCESDKQHGSMQGPGGTEREEEGKTATTGQGEEGGKC